jgi:hypothetical protein
LTLQGTGSLQLAGASERSQLAGFVKVAGGGTLTVNGAMSAAGVTVEGGMLRDDGSIQATSSLTGGTITGTGSLDGLLVNSGGTLAPGNPGSYGTFTVDGEYEQQPHGTLLLALGGYAPSRFDSLDVAGVLALGGTLSLEVAFMTVGGFQMKLISATSPPLSSFSGLIVSQPGAIGIRYEPTGVSAITSGTPTGAFVNIAPPVITGGAAVGSTLTCSEGSWSLGTVGASFSWYRGALAIAGATSAQYRVQAADTGSQLSCGVTVEGQIASSEVHGAVLTAHSQPVLVPGGIVLLRPPSVSGRPLPGHVLRCSRGVWAGLPTVFAYNWSRDRAPIAGANARTYRVRRRDRGHMLACRVTASQGGTVSSTSRSVRVRPRRR